MYFYLFCRDRADSMAPMISDDEFPGGIDETIPDIR